MQNKFVNKLQINSFIHDVFSFVLIVMNDVFSLLMVWLVCVQIWDMTQVVGSSVAAGFSPRWLAVSEGTAHTPPTEIMETLTYLSNSLILQLWSLCKTDTSTWCMWICVVGMLLDFMNQTFMSLMRYDDLDLSKHELKVLLKAQYLRSFCVCVYDALSQAEGFWNVVFPLSRSTTKTKEVFLHHILFLLQPSFLFIHFTLFEFECYYWS